MAAQKRPAAEVRRNRPAAAVIEIGDDAQKQDRDAEKAEEEAEVGHVSEVNSSDSVTSGRVVSACQSVVSSCGSRRRADRSLRLHCTELCTRPPVHAGSDQLASSPINPCALSSAMPRPTQAVEDTPHSGCGLHEERTDGNGRGPEGVAKAAGPGDHGYGGSGPGGGQPAAVQLAGNDAQQRHEGRHQGGDKQGRPQPPRSPPQRSESAPSRFMPFQSWRVLSYMRTDGRVLAQQDRHVVAQLSQTSCPAPRPPAPRPARPRSRRSPSTRRAAGARTGR